MLKHMVLWTLTEKAEAEGLARTAAKLNASAENMAGKIPGLVSSHVYLNLAAPSGVRAAGAEAVPQSAAQGGAVPAEEFHNLVFYSEFENPQALKAYQEHALHQAHREMAAPYVRNRETVDFEAPAEAAGTPGGIPSQFFCE
jgi:hypothetical protein